jgi:hypothetical protein
MTLTPEKAADLRKPFPKASIGKLPKGGAQLDFVGHAVVTDRLLMVDPAWTWEPFALDANGLPAVDQRGNLWIRLTVCGVTRIGVGDGKSPKELIGDALRNAAMRFGVALDLWSKEELEQGHLPETPAPRREPPKTDALGEAKARLWPLTARQGDDNARRKWITAALTARGLEATSPEDLTALAIELEAAA